MSAAREQRDDATPAFTLTRGELIQLMTLAAEEGARAALTTVAKPQPRPGRCNTGAVAAHYNVATSTVRSWVALGAPARRFGRDFVFDLEALDAWHEERNERKPRLFK